jgi:hypothetical protein
MDLRFSMPIQGSLRLAIACADCYYFGGARPTLCPARAIPPSNPIPFQSISFRPVRQGPLAALSCGDSHVVACLCPVLGSYSSTRSRAFPVLSHAALAPSLPEPTSFQTCEQTQQGMLDVACFSQNNATNERRRLHLVTPTT